MCCLGPTGESTFHPQLPNDNRTFLYHLYAEGFGTSPRIDADCAHWDFEVPNETIPLIYEDVTELCFQYSQLKLVTFCNLWHFNFSICHNQFFCSSDWYRIHCIRRPTRPEVIFQRLMATCEFIEPSCYCTVIRCRVTIHGDQTLMDYCCIHLSFNNKKLCYCRGTARRAILPVEILRPFFWLSDWQEALLMQRNHASTLSVEIV